MLPRYGLRDLFHPIVTSWEMRTSDKGELAAEALRLLDDALRPADALLIDDDPVAVESWRSRGGRAYLFRGEETLRADLEIGLEDLARAAGYFGV